MFLIFQIFIITYELLTLEHLHKFSNKECQIIFILRKICGFIALISIALTLLYALTAVIGALRAKYNLFYISYSLYDQMMYLFEYIYYFSKDFFGIQNIVISLIWLVLVIRNIFIVLKKKN